MVFSMISIMVHNILSGYTVKLTQLHTKGYVVPNLRTAINQTAVFMQDIAPCHAAESVKTFLSEEDVTVTE